MSLHYNGANSYSFVNGTEIYKFKAKYSEVLVGPICLRNISKYWPVDNMKRTEFFGYVYDFSVDFDPIAVDDIKEYIKCNKNVLYMMFITQKIINHTYKMGVIKQINIKLINLLFLQ